VDSEDAELRGILNTMGPDTLEDLQRMAQDVDPTSFSRALARRPDLASLTAELGTSETGGAARLRLLRAIRDHLSQD
jgi:hypothetical protein